MLSTTTIKKNLLDSGSLVVSNEAMGNNLPFQVSMYPHLTGTAKVDPGSETVTINFDCPEVQTHFASLAKTFGGKLSCKTVDELYRTLTVIHDHLDEFEKLFSEFQVAKELENQAETFNPDKNDTEAERLIKERRGQQIYRSHLEKLWSGSCAVTGICIPAVLRASHAKPWSECETGRERLDPFNGFLLSANLDALFDKFLISFDEDGRILLNPNLKIEELKKLGINEDMRLRFLEPDHLPYLEYHRKKFSELTQKTDLSTSRPPRQKF